MNNEEENVNSYIEKGEILLNDNKYDDALVFFNRVIECPQFVLLLNSIKYETYFNKGFTLWKLNKNIEAIECYNRAIEINPINSLSYLFKSFSLANLSMYEEANNFFLKARILNPETIILLWKNATLYFKALTYITNFLNFFKLLIFNLLLPLYFCMLFLYVYLDFSYFKGIIILSLITFFYLNSNFYILLLFLVFLIIIFFIPAYFILISSFVNYCNFYLYTFNIKNAQYRTIKEFLKK